MKTEKFKELLENKVAIITGASRGIGSTTAIIFAKAGARVVLAASDVRALEDVADKIHEFGGKALVVPTDVGNHNAVKTLTSSIELTFYPTR